jgi:hypothetical protein
MEFELKALSPEAVPRAIEKAQRYRLLSEPGEAESICRDVLRVDPDNQEAIETLLLAMTDQFEHDPSTMARVWEIVSRLRGAYERSYYTGIVYERGAKALLRQMRPLDGPQALEWLREAMRSYEHAETLRPPNNDDALLRWNACARLIMDNPRVEPPFEEPYEPQLLE